MKTYKSSALTNTKRCEVFEEAEKNGVIIQMCKTNGKVIKEFVMITGENFIKLQPGKGDL